jgi:hypothetical protein
MNTSRFLRFLHSWWLWLSLGAALIAPALSREGGEYIPIGQLLYKGLQNYDLGFILFILCEYAVYVALLCVFLGVCHVAVRAIFRYVRRPR